MKKVVILSLLIVFTLALSAQHPAKYWVEFKDKKDSPYSIERPEEFLSPRAIEKRQRFNIPITEQDLPVNESYIKQLLAIDETMVLFTKSKWLNGVTVYSEAEGIMDKILQLPFVSGAECTIIMDSEEDFDYPRSTYAPPAKTTEVLKIEEGKDLDYGYSYSQTNMNRAQWLHRMGAHGEGMFIMVLDGGFENANEIPQFEALRNEGRLIGTRNFVQPGRSVFVEGTHGTMTLSCMAGYMEEEMMGTAPKATYYLAQTEDGRSENKIEEDNWVAGAELADSLGCDLINSSLGYHKFDDKSKSYKYKDLDGETSRSTRAADIAVSKGIIVCVSAGNEGNDPWKYITCPADAKDALTVGGVDHDGIASPFSSYGPTSDNRVKPDAAAVGSQAVIARENGKTDLSYGTSFSSPILCGMTACLWQLFPERSADQVIHAVRLAGANSTHPDKQLGYGITNFIYAYNFLAQFDSNDDVTILPERAVSKGGTTKLYYNSSKNAPEFDIEVRLAGENTGAFKNFKMKKSTDAVKVKLPKVPAGRNYAIALLKVTDHDFNTSFVCMVGILNK